MKYGLLTIFCILSVLIVPCLSALDISSEEFYGMTEDELIEAKKTLLKLDDGFEKFVKLGYVYHFLSEKGISSAKDAVHNFQKALLIEPDNALVKAYLGSSYTLQAHEATKVAEIMKAVKLGIRILDEAYRAMPDDFELNSIYILNSLELSGEMFDRTSQVVLALENLESKFDSFDHGQKAGILYFRLRLYRLRLRRKEADLLLKKILKEYGDTEYAALAKKELE